MFTLIQYNFAVSAPSVTSISFPFLSRSDQNLSLLIERDQSIVVNQLLYSNSKITVIQRVNSLGSVSWSRIHTGSEISENPYTLYCWIVNSWGSAFGVSSQFESKFEVDFRLL